VRDIEEAQNQHLLVSLAEEVHERILKKVTNLLLCQTRDTILFAPATAQNQLVEQEQHEDRRG
jgi:hypothetical protein